MSKKVEVNVVEDPKRIADSCTEDTSLMCVRVEGESGQVDIIMGGADTDTDLAAALAACVNMTMRGISDEGASHITEMILKTVSMVLNKKDLASARLCALLQERIASFMTCAFIGGDGEDDEDCENCAMVHVCESSAAQRYREENHMAHPKKNLENRGN